MTIVIGLGGNVGTQAAIVARFHHARAALAMLGEVRSAPLYRSAPIGPAQAAFYNTAIALRAAEMQPRELIETVLAIERLIGRTRHEAARWGPRTIDLDVLLWDDRVIRTPELDVPHPRLTERRFALAPLADLVGEDTLVVGKPLAHWLTTVGDQIVEHLASSW